MARRRERERPARLEVDGVGQQEPVAAPTTSGPSESVISGGLLRDELVDLRAGLPRRAREIAGRTVSAAASPRRLVKPGASGSPACTRIVFGARSTTVGPPSPAWLSTPDSRRRPSAAASGPARCRAAAICAAGAPPAPHRAICSAAATLASENPRCRGQRRSTGKGPRRRRRPRRRPAAPRRPCPPSCPVAYGPPGRPGSDQILPSTDLARRGAARSGRAQRDGEQAELTNAIAISPHRGKAPVGQRHINGKLILV